MSSPSIMSKSMSELLHTTIKKFEIWNINCLNRLPRLPTDINPVAWWKSHAMELPKWANAFRLVLLVQPSSAAVERVFSILQCITEQQQSSLEDYLELSIMLQYNLAH